MSKRLVLITIRQGFVKSSGVAKGGRGGATAPPNRKKHSLKKAKSVEKLGGGVHVTSSKLKRIKYVSTEENDDILEELDL
jgi:hypothetical protein